MDWLAALHADSLVTIYIPAFHINSLLAIHTGCNLLFQVDCLVIIHARCIIAFSCRLPRYYSHKIYHRFSGRFPVIIHAEYLRVDFPVIIHAGRIIAFRIDFLVTIHAGRITVFHVDFPVTIHARCIIAFQVGFPVIIHAGRIITFHVDFLVTIHARCITVFPFVDSAPLIVDAVAFADAFTVLFLLLLPPAAGSARCLESFALHPITSSRYRHRKYRPL